MLTPQNYNSVAHTERGGGRTQYARKGEREGERERENRHMKVFIRGTCIVTITFFPPIPMTDRWCV